MVTVIDEGNPATQSEYLHMQPVRQVSRDQYLGPGWTSEVLKHIPDCFLHGQMIGFCPATKLQRSLDASEGHSILPLLKVKVHVLTFLLLVFSIYVLINALEIFIRFSQLSWCSLPTTKLDCTNLTMQKINMHSISDMYLEKQ